MVECENFPLNIYFLRNSDIPRYLADGVVDLAIIGQNLIKESELEIFEIMELNFSKCRVSIAIPEKMDFNNINDLNNSIDSVLKNKEKIASSGYNYVSKFDLTYFKNSWLDIISLLIEKSKSF